MLLTIVESIEGGWVGGRVLSSRAGGRGVGARNGCIGLCSL
jgi:hypothetical protein